MATDVTAFLGGRQIATGDRAAVAKQIKAQHPDNDGAVLVFENRSGRITDLDYNDSGSRTVGRPRLGVQAREITLLPRHWDWLAEQPGGASAAVRRLVEAARTSGQTDRERRDAAYRVMQAACGDMPGYEEALRALYAGQDSEFLTRISHWPLDIVRFITDLHDGIDRQAGPTADETTR